MAEITFTGEHPFFVGNRAQPDFVPARELQPGDSLSFSSGGQGQVISLASERAPPGQTFTTYNFEVADFHTYFAGEGGVWVHNFSAHFCEKLAAACWHSKKWLGIDNPAGHRFEILKHSFMHLFDVGKVPFDSLSGNRSLLVTALEELRDYSQHEDFRKIASFKDQTALRDLFNKLPDHHFEIHHLAEKRVSSALGINLKSVQDTSPGLALPSRASKWANTSDIAGVFDGPVVFHQGPGSIAEAIGDAFATMGLPRNYSGGALSPTAQRTLVDHMKHLYHVEPKFKHLNAWGATRDWLAANVTDAGLAGYIRAL